MTATRTGVPSAGTLDNPPTWIQSPAPLFRESGSSHATRPEAKGTAAQHAPTVAAAASVKNRRRGCAPESGVESIGVQTLWSEDEDDRGRCLAIWIFPAIRANFFEPHCLKLDLRRRLESLQPSSLTGISPNGKRSIPKHLWKCRNAVRIGDGCATVSGNRPPGRTRQSLDASLGRRGRGSKPVVRILRQRCSSGCGCVPQPLRRKAKDEARPSLP